MLCLPQWYLPIVLIATLSMSGCASTYVPNTTNTPDLRQAGDVHLGGHAGTNGFDVHGAVALSDHVGVLGNVSIADQSSDFESGTTSGTTETGTNHHRHRFGEVAVGYFERLGDRGDVQVYAGYGRGWAEALDEFSFLRGRTEPVVAKGPYSRWFIQPAVRTTVDLDWYGLSASDIGQLGFSTRLARVSFHKFETEETVYEETQTEVFLEPAVDLRFGSDRFRLGLQVGLSLPVTTRDFADLTFDVEPIWMSLGLQVAIRNAPPSAEE